MRNVIIVVWEDRYGFGISLVVVLVFSQTIDL